MTNEMEEIRAKKERPLFFYIPALSMPLLSLLSGEYKRFPVLIACSTGIRRF